MGNRRQELRGAVFGGRTDRLFIPPLLVVLGIGFILLHSSTSSTTSGERLLIGGIVIAAGGVVWSIVSIRQEIERRRHTSVERSMDRVIATWVREGRVLPVPAPPRKWEGALSQSQLRDQQVAHVLARIPWGIRQTVPSAGVEALFDRTVARVRGFTGDWSDLEGPLEIFAEMQEPYCFIGAAELLYALSYRRSSLHEQEGLVQGLRFTAIAEYYVPRHPDALITRATLLVAGGYDSWLSMARETIALLRDVAPEHKRLPVVEERYAEKTKQFDAALEANARILANPPSTEELYAAMRRRGMLFMSMKRLEDAEQINAELLAKKPDDPWTWHNQSIVLTGLKRYKEALDCNERALSIMNFAVAQEQGRKIKAAMSQSGQPT